MYNYQYKVRSDGYPICPERRTDTTLRVDFLFGKEVAPADIPAVKTRVASLRRFLLDYEQLDYGAGDRADVSLKDTSYSGRARSGEIRHFMFRLGFGLTLRSKGAIPIEQMLDMESLNKFMLTGRR